MAIRGSDASLTSYSMVAAGIGLIACLFWLVTGAFKPSMLGCAAGLGRWVGPPDDPLLIATRMETAPTCDL